MDLYTKLGIIIIGGIFMLWFVLFGIMMRKLDFSCLFDHPWEKKDGLYMRVGLKLEKIAEDTPENRKKASVYLGNFFIGFAVFLYFGVLIGVLTS